VAEHLLNKCGALSTTPSTAKETQTNQIKTTKIAIISHERNFCSAKDTVHKRQATDLLKIFLNIMFNKKFVSRI
jgi:hypothetical protein